MIRDLSQRIPCTDGTCIGTVNEECICNVCGKANSEGGHKNNHKDEKSHTADRHRLLSPHAKNRILLGLGFAFLFLWFLHIFFYFYYYSDFSPTTPNIATGQIYEVNNHGYHFYITEQQEIFAYALRYLAWGSIIAAIIFAKHWKIYSSFPKNQY